MDRVTRVALLACDRPDPDLIDLAGDYARMFIDRFRAVAGDRLAFEVVDVDLGMPIPPVGAHDAVLITGSRRSVRDEVGWIGELATHVQRLHAATIPTVGVCFGHQLIAHALGGQVDRAPNGWGVGVHDASRTEPDTAVPASFRLLVSHQDQVLQLPVGAEVLATSRHAPIAALRAGSLVGVQGHPEFSAAYAAALLARRRELMSAAVVDVAEASFATPTDHEAVLRWLAAHLASGAAESAPATAHE